MNRSRQTQGFALVITLLITALVGTLVTGSLLLSMTNRRISSNDALSTQALNVAQAGSAFWKAELVSLYRYMMENFDLYEDDITAYLAVSTNPPISCNNYFAIGIDLTRDGTVDTANATSATKLTPQPLSPNVTIPIGDTDGVAQVSFYINGSVVGLRSRGNFAGARATVVEEFNVSQIDLWNNAIFADTSAANATVQGRAEIRGSVHILGTGLSSSDTALNVSGNFGLGNTYQNLVNSVAQDVTGNTNPMRLTNQQPTDLCANLRVKSGRVIMDSQSSSIGFSESRNPEPYIDNMRGIYTNHKVWGGTEGGNVHSQNGMDAAYDAGDSFEFPDLNDPISDASSTKWWEQLFEKSLILSLDPTRDDRTKAGVVYSDEPGKFSSLSTGDTYLDASCRTSLFGVSLDGTVATAATQSEGQWLTEVRRLGLFVASLHPVFQHVLPILVSWADHNPNHKTGGGGGGGGGNNPTPSTLATRFTLSHNTTPRFECRKYRMLGSLPSISTDEIVTEVIWSGSTSGDIFTSGGEVPFGSNELYVGGTGGGVAFWGAGLELIGGNNLAIRYRGDGVLFAETNDHDNLSTSLGGFIDLFVNFLPATGDAYRANDTGRLERLTGIGNTYPATALVGLVARDVVRTDGSQGRYTTAIYAQASVALTQQDVLAGAIVTKEFNLGSNVPTVLYVPNLAQRLSRMMPGAGGKGFAVSNVAWNRR